MKKIVLFFILGVFISCTDKNDDFITDASLAGEWELTDVICFCGFEENVDFSTNKLLFNTIENRITVIHETNDNYFYISGVFNYELDIDTITLEGDTRSYTYAVEGDILTLTYIDDPMIADDEITYKYSRI